MSWGVVMSIPDRVKTDYVVIHCSDTPPTMDIGAKEIRQWHTSPDKNDLSKPWADIGYHFVIRRNGQVEAGRKQNQVGSHVRGFNSSSIGICMVGGRGGNHFTGEQFDTLKHMVAELAKEYPDVEFVGHRDLNAGKECPSFSVSE